MFHSNLLGRLGNGLLKFVVLVVMVCNVSGAFATVTTYEGNRSYVNLTIAANDTIIIKQKKAADGTITENGNLTITGKLTLNDKSYLVVGGDFSLSSSGSITYNGGAISVRGDMTQSSGAKITVSSGKTGSLTVMGTFHDNANNNHPWEFNEHRVFLILGEYYWYTFDVADNFTFNAKSYQNSKISSGSGWGINNRASALKDLLDDLEENGSNYNETVLSEKIKEISTLLPIELTSFTAMATDYGFVFNWVTASEVENDYFTLEYSIDGVDFNEIDYVHGAGTTSETSEYEYRWDEAPKFDVVYFRLKQTDYNGEYSYSDVIAASRKKSSGANGTFRYGPLNLQIVDGELRYIQK